MRSFLPSVARSVEPRGNLQNLKKSEKVPPATVARAAKLEGAHKVRTRILVPSDMRLRLSHAGAGAFTLRMDLKTCHCG